MPDSKSTNSSVDTFLKSTFFEQLVEHVFISELLQEVYYRFGITVEVLRSEIDASGYDIVFECNRIIRHVQLKTSTIHSKTSRQEVNIALADKPSGCVIWIIRTEDSEDCRMSLTYRFFGGVPGQPLPSLDSFSTAKHTKGNKDGVKAERPSIREIPKGQFESVATTTKLIHRLFGLPKTGTSEARPLPISDQQRRQTKKQLLKERYSMHWIYQFTKNKKYPNPISEIDDLCSLDDSGEDAFLLLADSKYPPMSNASEGEIVGLCTSEDGELKLHGTAVLAGDCLHGPTPKSVMPIYGKCDKRKNPPPKFMPLNNLIRIQSKSLPEANLASQDQIKFLKGQAFVKRLKDGKVNGSTAKPQRNGTTTQPNPAGSPAEFKFPRINIAQSFESFSVIGLDPTAGTWETRMTEGPKQMPSLTLRWNGSVFQAATEALKNHTTNDDFWNEVDRTKAVLCCIDGPCDTNGPRLLSGATDWDPNGAPETRDAESSLSDQGINLFWTTQNTVTNWDGPSRWIARSLVLFDAKPEHDKIETHPHGAFTFLWRLFDNTDSLPKKKTSRGRNARLAMIRAFVPDLADDLVPNDDAVDAAIAALVAGLHRLSLTTPFGTDENGGQIWMPDIEKLKAMLPELNKAEDV
ncbi:DUF429 domain-containing protein [bacterium]|nr:DUF429 domain-containing protein [Rubripirellula sp.]MDA7492635.1 DUF429 domain-containing protein [bacterium]MDB4654268.1 DUF429 domain-containing protein [Rubripirellula sp.]